jgi:hypothetical protein
MQIRHATASKPTRSTNDDLAGYAGRTFWLMDGATQLHEPAHGLTAAWHVGQLDACFRAALAQDPQIDLADLATAAITQTADTFFAQSGMTVEDSMMERPFCTLALCRVNEAADKLEYLVLCDSSLLVLSPQDEKLVSDLRLDDLNALDPTNALLKAGAGFDSAEYKAALLSAYHHVFAHLNMPDGWYAVAQDASVVSEALRGDIAVTPDDVILLMSDGFTRAVDTLGVYTSWRALTKDVTSKGLDAVIESIRKTERADAEGRKHPRSSRHDDATALWVQL